MSWVEIYVANQSVPFILLNILLSLLSLLDYLLFFSLLMVSLLFDHLQLAYLLSFLTCYFSIIPSHYPIPYSSSSLFYSLPFIYFWFIHPIIISFTILLKIFCLLNILSLYYCLAEQESFF